MCKTHDAQQYTTVQDRLIYVSSLFWLMQANGVQACVVCDQEAAIYSVVPGVIIKYGGLRLSKPPLTWNSLGTEFLLDPAISGSLREYAYVPL